MFSTQPPPPRHAVGDETRQLLLDAATGVFLRDGFRAARVKDIAAAAGVRLSGINYHFGGKEGLYLAVLQHHAGLALQHAPLPPAAAALPLEQRFRQFVEAMVMRMLDPRNPSRIASLMVREAVNPTPALQIMFEQFTHPQAARLLAMLGELFGPQASADLLARSALGVVAQSMIYVGMGPLVERLRPGFYQREDGVAELAAHIATFSWAGLQGLATTARNPHAC